MSKTNANIQKSRISSSSIPNLPGLKYKNGHTNILRYEIILVEWNSVGEHFLNEVQFEDHPFVRIHLFFNKTKKHCEKLKTLTKKLSFNLILHESHTSSDEASWIHLLTYLINFKARSTIFNKIASQHSRISHQLTLVTNNDGKHKEAEELLKSTNAFFVDGWSCTIIDLFENVCRACKIVFRDVISAEKHDRIKHNFLCNNLSCERSQRNNGFYCLDEHKKHLRKQKRCEHCLDKIFCNIETYKEHMSEYHVLCKCPCNQYYGNIDEFIAHYCSFYPLPCLEDADCRGRFKSIDEQSFHHKSKHGSALPYFCLACYKQSKLKCFHNSEELMKHVNEAKHIGDNFHLLLLPNEME